MPDETTTNLIFNVSTEDVPKEGSIFSINADPLTAGFTALAAFFNFLSTPAGQRIVTDILNFDAEFAHKIHDLFEKIHDFIGKKV